MRGEWIEMPPAGPAVPRSGSLPMRGEWIEMGTQQAKRAGRRGLSPCGESGLKSKRIYLTCNPGGSLPMRGEWIEIAKGFADVGGIQVSPHAGRVD